MKVSLTRGSGGFEGYPLLEVLGGPGGPTGDGATALRLGVGEGLFGGGLRRVARGVGDGFSEGSTDGSGESAMAMA